MLFQHDMTVIASDGIDLEPYTVSGLVIHIGERYDVYINANQAVSTYWIRFTKLDGSVGNLEIPSMSYFSIYCKSVVCSWPKVEYFG